MSGPIVDVFVDTDDGSTPGQRCCDIVESHSELLTTDARGLLQRLCFDNVWTSTRTGFCGQTVRPLVDHLSGILGVRRTSDPRVKCCRKLVKLSIGLTSVEATKFCSVKAKSIRFQVKNLSSQTQRPKKIPIFEVPYNTTYH